jgi:hypothetical protein
LCGRAPAGAPDDFARIDAAIMRVARERRNGSGAVDTLSDSDDDETSH